jgi:hypothetical protein
VGRIFAITPSILDSLTCSTCLNVQRAALYFPKNKQWKHPSQHKDKLLSWGRGGAAAAEDTVLKLKVAEHQSAWAVALAVLAWPWKLAHDPPACRPCSWLPFWLPEVASGLRGPDLALPNMDTRRGTPIVVGSDPLRMALASQSSRDAGGLPIWS